ncbi:MAG: hypothetical protein ACC652_09565, partial [Acidimicrobiales bacterium]
GTVHGLFAELGVGTVTHSTLQLGLAFSALFAALGLTLLTTGGGLVLAGRAKEPIEVPDTIPEALLTEQRADTQDTEASLS